MSCSKCDKKAYVEYKDKKYCTWYCAKKGQFMIEYEYGVYCAKKKGQI